MGLRGRLGGSLAIASMLALTTPAVATTHSYAPGTPLHHTTLSNGLQVLCLPLPNSPVTTFQVWVRAGSRDETPGITGIAHLFEHMMFRPVAQGAPSYYDQAAALGLQYNASTRFGATEYHETFRPDLLNKVNAMEANRFKRLVVSPEMLKVEREAVRSEYSTKLDSNPIIDLWFWIYRQAFASHPYGWHIVGVREDLDRINAEDCNRFYRANYAANNSLIVVAGPINPKTTLDLVKSQWGDWRKAPPRKAWTNEPPLGKKPSFGYGKLNTPTKYVVIGYRTPDRTKPDRLAQDLAHHMLFNEKNSLVARRLIDEKHLASEADAFNTLYDIALSKVLVVPNAGVDPHQIEREVQDVADHFERVSDADFDAYRRAFATFRRESQLKTEDVSAELGKAWAYDGDFRFAYTDPEAMLQLPRAAVAKVLKTYYRPANRVTVVSP